MLEVTGLSLEAGNFTVHDVSLTVRPCSRQVILGSTGSGKTLLLEAIIGLRRPKRGRITLDGEDITHLPIHKRGLSYVPQDLALFPHLTVRENILYPVRIKGREADLRSGALGLLVDALEIRPLLDRTIGGLSGGERQRTALARAIAAGGKVIVLDEPLSALHESLKKSLWRLLIKLGEEFDLSILMVTHDLHEAFFLGDDVSVMLGGRVRRQGTNQEVYAQPRTVEVAAFLGVKNILPVRIIETHGDCVIVRCKDLDATLRVARSGDLPIPQSGADCFVGVRSENVRICGCDATTHDDGACINGVITEVFEAAGRASVSLACDGPAGILEADSSSDEWRRLRFGRGDRVRLCFSPNSLMLLESDASA
jgi:ABC-type Fe3+/spermidine/putrescine transport system ATPase subunit